MLVIAGITGGAFLLSGVTAEEAGNQQIQKTPLQKKICPDLVLEKVKVTSEPWEPGKKKIKIEYTLFNNSSVSAYHCPTEEGLKAWKENPVWNLTFECSAMARSYPNGRYYKLPNGGKVGCILKPMERGTLYAVDIVPDGAVRQYRIRLDPGNWISETNEDNNQKTVMWPKRKLQERKTP